MRAEHHPWLTAFAVLSILAGLILAVVALFFADVFLTDLEPARVPAMQVGLAVTGAVAILGSVYALIATGGFKRWGAVAGWQKALALLTMLPGLVVAGMLWVVWISISNRRRR